MSKTPGRTERRKQRLEVVYRATGELKPDPANPLSGTVRTEAPAGLDPGDIHFAVATGSNDRPSP
jgi:hypothetical protein